MHSPTTRQTTQNLKKNTSVRCKLHYALAHSASNRLALAHSTSNKFTQLYTFLAPLSYSEVPVFLDHLLPITALLASLIQISTLSQSLQWMIVFQPDVWLLFITSFLAIDFSFSFSFTFTSPPLSSTWTVTTQHANV